MKFANQNFPYVGIFVFRETTKFLFTLQARKIDYILLQKVLNCTLFSCILIAFWPQTPNGGLQRSPIPSVGTSPKIFADHFWKDNSNPAITQIYKFLAMISVWNLYCRKLLTSWMISSMCSHEFHWKYEMLTSLKVVKFKFR